jgi:glutamyl-tRNA synthetase
MFDFENPIEEGLTGVTHAMRSNEFDSRIELHNHIAKLLNFPEVFYKHYGRYNVVGATTQGREIRSLIETGKYIGWDDPRLVTLRALKRRGIVKEAYYELAKKIGFSKTQTNLDYSVIAAVSRSLLDKSAKRFFAVKDPVVITVNNIPENLTQFNLSYYPDDKNKNRKLSCTKKYYLEKLDNDLVKINQVVRFMDAMNVKKIDSNIYEFASLSYDEYKVTENTASLIHFVPKDGNEIKAEILLPDTNIQDIICESNLGTLKPDVVIQFERYAFVRFDHVRPDGTIQFWYTHD